MFHFDLTKMTLDMMSRYILVLNDREYDIFFGRTYVLQLY